LLISNELPLFPLSCSWGGIVDGSVDRGGWGEGCALDRLGVGGGLGWVWDTLGSVGIGRVGLERVQRWDLDGRRVGILARKVILLGILGLEWARRDDSMEVRSDGIFSFGFVFLIKSILLLEFSTLAHSPNNSGWLFPHPASIVEEGVSSLNSASL